MSSEGSALTKLRQPSSVVVGSAAVLQLPVVGYHHFSASLRASNNGNGITCAGVVSVSALGLSPAIGLPGGVLVRPSAGRGHCGAAVAAARPATRRERGERVRPAAWSCCGTAWPAGALSGPVEQIRGRRGDLGLGGGVGAAGGQQLPGVVPGLLAERHRSRAKVFPGRGQPAAVVVVADPDPGDVVGILCRPGHHPDVHVFRQAGTVRGRHNAGSG